MGDYEFAERMIVDAGSRFAEMLEILIQAGADINASDAEGWTPLHLAAGYGTSEMVHILLEAGANARARTLSGAVPFDMAQLNEILKESSAYWLLNDARF